MRQITPEKLSEEASTTSNPSENDGILVAWVETLPAKRPSLVATDRGAFYSVSGTMLVEEHELLKALRAKSQVKPHETPMVKVPPEQLSLSVRPIGVIRTTMRTKFDSPHQPINSDSERSVIELFPGHGFDVALRDLEQFDRIWLVWWFHRNSTWRPLVLPPRGDAVRRGVFATRSPHRPNPIGITAVPLISVSKLSITVGNTDLVDGTPILDIKPYIPGVDAFPDASSGWVTDVEQKLLDPVAYTVTCTALATTQIEWLREKWGIAFFERAAEILQRDPTIHRTRRIRKWQDDHLQMGCGAWRLIFAINGSRVDVLKIVPGYPDSLLLQASDDEIPDQQAQIAFKSIWPDEEKFAPTLVTSSE